MASDLVMKMVTIMFRLLWQDMKISCLRFVIVVFPDRTHYFQKFMNMCGAKAVKLMHWKP